MSRTLRRTTCEVSAPTEKPIPLPTAIQNAKRSAASPHVLARLEQTVELPEHPEDRDDPPDPGRQDQHPTPTAHARGRNAEQQAGSSEPQEEHKCIHLRDRTGSEVRPE